MSSASDNITPRGNDNIFSNTRLFGPQVTALINQIKRIDWAETDFGHISQWPSELHQLLNIIMLDDRPLTLVYGQKGNILYNSSYARQVAGDRHPRILGQPMSQAWPESYPAAADGLKAALEHATVTEQGDTCVFLQTPFGLQESFFRWNIIPLVAPLYGSYLAGFPITEEV